MRILSGIQSSGKQHVGNYYGALRQFVDLQNRGDETLYFIANLHALTTVRDPAAAASLTRETAMAFLALGLDPARAMLFRQSDIPEVTELYWILGTVVPRSNLERAHSYKDKLARGIPADFGLFAYPVLMAADILLYGSDLVPVGRDQVQHLEFARDWATKFNLTYVPGYDPADPTGTRTGRQGILKLPEALVQEATAVVPGTDGQKMSKSYNNTISLREDAESVRKKIRTMPTDPARVKRTDKGDPDKCPVWQLHLVYSDDKTRKWANIGCRTAGIGCLECKEPVIEAVLAEQGPMRERAQKYLDDPTLVRNIVADGCERARKLAEETMRDVRASMGLDYT